MDLAFEILKHVQYYVGGGVVYLDCEDIDKVLRFYQSDYNRFKMFGERFAESEGKRYLQLLIFLINYGGELMILKKRKNMEKEIGNK